jgi:uncharacterized Zn finger protein
MLKDMKCDTCGKETAEVRRVVIDSGYDRTLARAMYTCPACYEKKESSRGLKRPQG